MDSLEALQKIRQTAKELEGSAQILRVAAQAMDESSAVADWLSLQPIMGRARVLSFKLSPDGAVDSVFGGLNEALGWLEDELRGRQLADLLDPSVEFQEPPLAFLSVEDGPAIEFRQALAFLHRSGWRVWLDVTLSPHQSSTGTLLGYRGIAFDISEERLRINELERRMAENQKELTPLPRVQAVEEHPEPETDLWSTVCRRQQSILLSGLARLTVLLRESNHPEYLGGLEWAVHWLTSVTRLSHDPLGWRAVNTFSPRLELERAAALFRPVGASQAMSGRIEANPTLPEEISANLGALRAAILEIMEWASRTLPHGGLVIALDTSADGNLHVAFKCYGIVDEQEERAEQSLDLQELSTCRKFLKVLGGRLRVDRFLDGVEVQISLNCQASDDLQPTPRTRVSGEGLRVLLAEDDEISRKVAVRALKNLGHQVDSVATGLEVLQAVTDMDYDVVLLDVMMPDMDGVEAARQLRRRFFPCPYLIALTSGNTAADRRRVMEAGMHDFLAKPLKSDDLRDALSQIPFFTSAPPSPSPSEAKT